MGDVMRGCILGLGLLFLAVVVGCQKTTKKTPDDKGEVPKPPPQVGLLVEPAQLQELLSDENTKILDVRSETEYAMAHVPGAVRVDLAAWKAQALENDGAGLKDKAAWEKLIRAHGIKDLDQVVVYADANALTSAARIWWTLKYLGVERAGILNGGWQNWTKSQGKTSTEAPDVKPGDFSVEFQADRLAHAESLKDADKSSDTQIVDARSQSEVDAGIIPGAVPLEWVHLQYGDGRMKSPRRNQDDLQGGETRHGQDDRYLLPVRRPCSLECLRSRTGGLQESSELLLQLAAVGRAQAPGR